MATTNSAVLEDIASSDTPSASGWPELREIIKRKIDQVTNLFRISGRLLTVSSRTLTSFYLVQDGQLLQPLSCLSHPRLVV